MLSLLPLKCLYCISSVAAWGFVKFSNQKRNIIVRRNLRRCFPERNDKEIRLLHHKVFLAYFDFFAEMVKMPFFKKKSIKRRCFFKNLDVVDNAFKNHEFVICYSGHLVNYEWLVSFPLHRPIYGMCHLYLAKSSKSNFFVKLLLRIRSRFGAINIPSYSPLRTLVRLKNSLSTDSRLQGYIFGTLADIDPKEQFSHSSYFFDRSLDVKTGSERIGRKMNMAFLYANITRPKRGNVEVEFIEIKPWDVNCNPYAYTDEYVRLLENNIRQQPELWMQWCSPRF